MRVLAALLLLAQAPGTEEPNLVLGRPTDRSVTLNVIAPVELEAFVEYGGKKTATARLAARQPHEFALTGLVPGARQTYRLHTRRPGAAAFAPGAEYGFQTQRAPGAAFTFGVQGDSHPERLNRMFHPDLYVRTMENVRRDRPDFYFLMGDDFNPVRLYNSDKINAESIAGLYAYQRRFLQIIGRESAVFLVNGNHEEAARYLLDGTPNSLPVLTGRARNSHFSLPAPDGFYTGDEERVEHLGLRRDYYAWTWGDALFVTLDPYWHSPAQIDSGLGARERRNRDGWAATMGEAQYQWFRRTLAESKAKYKFVFAHHVLGTGRGAVEVADLFEWGGRNRNGDWEFDKKRPNWPMPVHQLMVKYGVTIFFQGHDHLFARQEKDGVIYQELPNPADNTYTAFNRDAYRSGDVYPNAGYLRVAVTPAQVKVDYVRSWLAKDESEKRKNGEVAFTYVVKPKQ